jgi:hypothetical protein
MTLTSSISASADGARLIFEIPDVCDLVIKRSASLQQQTSFTGG